MRASWTRYLALYLKTDKGATVSQCRGTAARKITVSRIVGKDHDDIGLPLVCQSERVRGSLAKNRHHKWYSTH